MIEKKTLMTETSLTNAVEGQIMNQIAGDLLMPSGEYFGSYRFYRMKDTNFPELTKKLIFVEAERPKILPSSDCYNSLDSLFFYEDSPGKYLEFRGEMQNLSDEFNTANLNLMADKYKLQINKGNVLKYVELLLLIESDRTSQLSPRISYELSDIDFMLKSDRFSDKVFNSFLKRTFHKPVVKNVASLGKDSVCSYEIEAFVLFPINDVEINLVHYDWFVNKSGHILKYTNNSLSTYNLATGQNKYHKLFKKKYE
jgi:hypothetical protein